MNLSLLQSIRPLVVTVAMTLLLASCGDGHSPNAPGDDSEDLSLVKEDGGRGDGVERSSPASQIHPRPSPPSKPSWHNSARRASMSPTRASP